MIGPLGWHGPAATLEQHCSQMTQVDIDMTMKHVAPAVCGCEEGEGEPDVDPDGDDVAADQPRQLPQPDLGGV